ncbi:MAG: AAA family ATPase [Microthrixaceae bacterium]
MRIHSIELTDFRGVDHRHIEFPETGVTIIEGDNEVGKSSIDEAVRLVLSEPDSTKKSDVRDVQPVGRDVGPQITIELSTGPYRLRCTKRFLKRPYTELDVLAPAAEQLTGRGAHDRLREILTATMDETLWAALQMPQGSELHQAEFGSGSLGAALDRAAGGERADESDSNGLWQRIVAERNKYFTATGQRGKELKAADASVLEAEAVVVGLEADLRSLEADSERVTRLGEQSADLQAQTERNESALAELRAAAKVFDDRRSELDTLRARVEEAGGAHQRALESCDERERLVTAVKSAQECLEELEARTGSIVEAHQADSERVEVASVAVDVARVELRSAEAAHRRAVEDRDHLLRSEQLDAYRGRRDRVAIAIEQRTETRRVIEANRVDSEALAVIEDAHSAMVVAQAAVLAGSPSLIVEALDELDVSIDGQSEALDASERREVVVSDSTTLEVPGSLKVTIRAGADAQDLSRRLTEASELLDVLLERHVVADIHGARKSAYERQAAERELAGLDHTIESELRGSTPEELTVLVDELVERVRTYPLERSSDEALAVDLDAAEQAIVDLDALIERARQDLSKADDERDRLRMLLTERAHESTKAEVSLQHSTDELEALRADLSAARRRCGDEEVTTRLDAAREVLESRRVCLESASESFDEAQAQSVRDRLQNALGVQERLTRQIAETREQLAAARARLEAMGERGLGGTLDGALSDLERVSGERDRLDRRANAARALHDVFATRREQARRRYVAPLRERVHRLGRIVFGPSFEVDLDDDLKVVGRTLDGATVPYKNLSTGAKEQIGMIMRLAAAEIVATDGGGEGSSSPGGACGGAAHRGGGGAPVVLDDALGWSDPTRLEAMGAVLSTAANETQVIVLTCTPGRYESVGGAHVVCLEGS